jgi:hypothetical protein
MQAAWAPAPSASINGRTTMEVESFIADSSAAGGKWTPKLYQTVAR